MLCGARFSLLIILSCMSLAIAYPANDEEPEGLDDPATNITLYEPTSEPAQPEEEKLAPTEDAQEEPPEDEAPTPTEGEESAQPEDELAPQTETEDPTPSEDEQSAAPEAEEETPSDDESPVQSDDEQPSRDDDTPAEEPPSIEGRMSDDMGEGPGIDETLYYPTGVTQQFVPHVRIVGGEIARNRAEYAYQASFRYTSQNTHFCGASIIDRTHLITAAHCVVDTAGRVVSTRNLKVVVGDLNKRTPTDTTVSRDILNIWVHPEFSTTTFQNDVAVLRVEDFGNFTEYISSIELATTTPADGTMCVVSGWGTTSSGGVASDDLQFVNVPIVGRETCQTNYGSSIMDGMLCAGFMEGERDACQGDSGGPLVCDNKLAGIVSWGYYCAIKGYPGIYADVALYYDWIREQQGLTRIVDGEATPEVKATSDIVDRRDQFPYQASLRMQSANAHFCGATIIDSTHVVTAAQCVTNYDGNIIDPKELSVVVGDTNIREETDRTKYRTVSAIFPHPDYSSVSFVNDIAVLRVSEGFGPWDQYVNYVNITSEKPRENTGCVISGWGTSSIGKFPSERLRYSTVPVVSYSSCVVYYDDSIKGGMMCAGHIEKGKDSCQGDSGGPLVCNSQLSGIVSWGLKCADQGFPGVFTDVSLYKSWIEEQTERSSAVLAQASICLILFTVLPKLFI